MPAKKSTQHKTNQEHLVNTKLYIYIYIYYIYIYIYYIYIALLEFFTLLKNFQDMFCIV